MKKWGMLLLAGLLLLAGCGANGQTAEEHGSGLSVEFTSDPDIRHVQLIQYKEGERVPGMSVMNADGSPFKKGEIILFDMTPAEWSGTTAFAIAYSKDKSGKDVRTTKMEKIPENVTWVNAKFSERDGLTVEAAE